MDGYFDYELECTDGATFEDEYVTGGSYFDSSFGNYLPWDSSTTSSYEAITEITVTLTFDGKALAVVPVVVDYYEDYEPEWDYVDPPDDAPRGASGYMEPRDMDEDYAIDRAREDEGFWDDVRKTVMPGIVEACEQNYGYDEAIANCDDLREAIEAQGSLAAVCSGYAGCAL